LSDVRFGSKADMRGALNDVRLVPIADIGKLFCTNRKTASRWSLRNSIRYLIRLREQQHSASCDAKLIPLELAGAAHDAHFVSEALVGTALRIRRTIITVGEAGRYKSNRRGGGYRSVIPKRRCGS
jgi:hypothetical protein